MSGIAAIMHASTTCFSPIVEKLKFQSVRACVGGVTNPQTTAQTQQATNRGPAPCAAAAVRRHLPPLTRNPFKKDGVAEPFVFKFTLI